MFKKERFIGLDIGASSIKLVELKRAGTQREIVRFQRMELGSEEDPALHRLAVVKAISQALRQEKLKNAWTAVSISGQSAFVKFLKLPRMAEKKVDQIIRYEAQQQVPFPINEVVWDYQILEDKAGAEVEVALVAIKTGIIDQLLGMFEKASLNIELINTTSLALYNLFRFCGGHEKATALLDMGARTTNVIIGSGETVWIRSLPMAGEDITRALAEELSLSLAEAETKKREKGIILLEGSAPVTEDSEERRISAAVAPVVADLASEILNSVTYFNSQYKDIIIERVFLTGGASRLRNLDRFLEANLGFPVEKFDCLSHFRVSKALGEKIGEQAPYLGVALGLALQRQKPVSIGVSLLPEAEVKSQAFKKKKDYIFFAQGLAILIVAALTLLARLDARWEQQNLDRIRSSHEDFKGLDQKVKVAEREIQPIRTKIGLLEKIHARRSFYLRIFDKLALLLPSDIRLDSITVQEAEREEENEHALYDESDSYVTLEAESDEFSLAAEQRLAETKRVSAGEKKEKQMLVISGTTSKPLVSVNQLVSKLEQSELFSKVEILSADYISPADGAGQFYEGRKERRAYVTPGMPPGAGMGEKFVFFRIQMLVEREVL